jgi:hypothetical protein
VKRSTAIGHLVELASESADMVRLANAEIGWPLTELWVTGELLTDAPTLEWASVVLVLDLPAVVGLAGVKAGPKGRPTGSLVAAVPVVLLADGSCRWFGATAKRALQ